MRLTPLQQRFVEEYLVDLNATQAAIRAGYSPRTARVTGPQNLSKPVVQEKIAQAQAERSKRTGITADRVVQELGRVAFANIADVVTWSETVVTLRSADELGHDVKAAVARLRQSADGAIEIKMHNKLAALVNLGRHLGLFAPVTRENGTDTPGRRIGKKEQQAIDSEHAADGSDWGDDLDRARRKPH